MRYLDFDLEIETADEGRYRVSVVHSPAGQADAQVDFPYDRPTLESMLKSLQISLLRSGAKSRSVQGDEAIVRKFGQDLFATIFPPPVLNRLEISRQMARDKGRGLRIRLRITSPELVGLPWEYVYDPGQHDYVALSASPLVRYVPLAQPIQPLRVTPPLRILAMAAGPKDMAELDVAAERERLEHALEGLRERGLVELEWVPRGTAVDLQDAFWRGPWHVFHFIGHGGYSDAHASGVVYLSDERGNSRALTAADLARVLGRHDPLRLAILNSCDTAQGTETDVFSSTAAALVQRGTPAVVAMQFNITDDAAIRFSRTFYATIARGYSVDAAVTEARMAIRLALPNTYEWGTPVLFMRSDNGLLFRVPREQAAAAAQVVREQETGESPLEVAQPAEPTSAPPLPVTFRADPPPAEDVPTAPPPPTATAPAPPAVPARPSAAVRPRELARIVNRTGVSVLAFSADGSLLASGGNGRSVFVSDAQGGVPLAELGHGAITFIRALAFSPDGTMLAAACDDFPVMLWPVAQGMPAKLEGSDPSVSRLPHQNVHGLAFSADGTALATAGNDHQARVWDLRTRTQRAALAHDAAVKRVAFDPSGALLAAGTESGEVRIWRLADGQVAALTKWQSLINAGCAALAFNSDGTLLGAAPEYNRSARVMEPLSGIVRYELAHPTVLLFGSVLALAFSPDGSRLATACGAGKAFLWGAHDGRQLAELGHSGGSVNSLAFDPRGNLLATAGQDGTGRLWDVATGRQVAQLNHDKAVRVLTFSPDGSRLATGSDDRTARVWAFD